MLPPLAKPVEGEALYLYLSVSGVAISSVLVKEENMIHVLVYFVSKVLNQVEMKYLEIEKYLYALIFSTRKLCPYFDAHNVTILTNQPLKHFLQMLDVSGRMLK